MNIALIKQIDFTGKTLIIPSVSIGNVGQLSIDLLISNLHLEKVGTIWSRALIPVAGSNPYDLKDKSISTACEIYAQSDSTVVTIQIRSGIYNKFAHEFLTELTKFVKENHFEKVVILTSCFSYEQHMISTSPFRYLANEAELNESKSKIQSLGWLQLEKNVEQSGNVTAMYSINGGGFALKLYENLIGSSVKSLLIMKYCSEGDNIPDSLALIKYLNGYLNLSDDLNTQISFPPSWDLLFGGPPPVGIY